MDGEEEMKNFIKSDYFLLTVAAIVSVFLWIFVSYEVNPIHERWIENINIEYTNETQEFETGKLVIISGNESEADIRIRGKRGDISVFDYKDITCSVNLAGINTPGKYTLPVTFTSSVYGIEFVQKNPNSVELVVDEVVTSEYNIEVVTTGNIGEEYTLGDVTFTPETVKITGPKTIVEKIKVAKVVVDVTDVTSDIVGLYKIKLYDENNTEITDNRISSNIEYCDVTLPVYAKKELNIVPVLSDETNSEGDKIVVGEMEPKKIYIIGESDVIKDIGDVYTNMIYTSNIYNSMTGVAELDLSQLPEGVTVENDVKSVKLVFEIENNTENNSQEHSKGGN